MLKEHRMFIWMLLLVLVGVWFVFYSGPAPLQAEDGINVLEQIELGGAKQWVSIRGVNAHAPVLLFLHGGPGSANLAKLRLQTPELEEHFVVVNWDQRGAGKSSSLNFDHSTLSLEQMIGDVHELVGYLKARFDVEKVYLMGFSWGTMIGLELVDRYPDDFYAYISVSQVVNYAEGERLSLEFVRQAAQQAGNQKAIAELSAIDPAYTSPDWFAQLTTERQWLLHFGGVYHTADSYWHEAWMLLHAPEYSLADFALWPGGSSASMRAICPSLMAIDFSRTIPSVGVPIYFFAGRYDNNAPSTLTEAYFRQLDAPAGKHLVWFEGSAHDPFFDEPEKVVTETLAVLEEQP
jgi:pimeloyl-ACP methyl ester carboxylesterase